MEAWSRPGNTPWGMRIARVIGAIGPHTFPWSLRIQNRWGSAGASDMAARDDGSTGPFARATFGPGGRGPFGPLL